MYFDIINEDTLHEKISLCALQPDFQYENKIIYEIK